MELRDLIVTPIVLILTFLGAYIIRPYVTDPVNRRYFIPALSVKIVGAIALGLIYQFYYSGGDTFNFHTHGSRHIWEAFMESPEKALGMMFSNGQHEGSFYKYSSQIYFFTDPSSFFVIRTAAIFDLFTFSTYSSTAICFAIVSFIGVWFFFLTFYKKYPKLHQQIAFAAFFIPSVFFWGSGLLKDTLVMACLGVTTYELHRFFIERKVSVKHIVLLVLTLWCIFSVKKFILQAYLPAALFWIYFSNLQVIRSMAVRVIVFPLILIFSVVSIYVAVVKVGEGDKRYAVENLAETSRITAYDIRYQTGRDAGSGYSIGSLDGSLETMLKLMPQAISVSLFRPYLWEVKNPLMLLSAMESTLLLLFVVVLLVRKGTKVLVSFRNPDISFGFIFSIVFAFAVGISSFNFGTLVRYKIPMLPFFVLTLVLMFYENNPKKAGEFEARE